MSVFASKEVCFGNRRGIALLIVLASIAILTIVVIAFLANGLSEIKNAKVYSSGANVKLLSQTAVNLVLGEIKDGTSGQDPAGKLVTWASQPGMIRTFRTQDTAPAFDYAYKLYSSGTMVLTGTINLQSDLTNMQNWYNNPAFYTDLNSPVTVSGRNHYPILPGDINGTAMNAYTTTDYQGNTISGLTYGPAGNPDIQGFWVKTPGSTGALPVAAVASNPVPMPVQWLYVLQDGTVVAPSDTATSATSSAKTTVTIPGATASNPIIGRIAFWTDDESSKVNINTASEGTYVDTPRVATVPEVNLANYQPAQHEFQRYPGHPAMTSLSTVFGSWLTLPTGTTQNVYSGITAGNFATYLEPYYNLIPKLVAGDSAATGGIGSMGATSYATATPSLDLTKAKRPQLYDSVDELIFSSSRSANPPVGTTTPPTLTESNLEETKFFLTAHSRSPDVNLFNQPRVGIWPITLAPSGGTTSNYQTTLDQLIAFCTSVGKTSGVLNPFYFQRQDYSSPSNDISISRNQQLLRYLKTFCNQGIPGFSSGSFRAKYHVVNPYPSQAPASTATSEGTDLDQIFTEIFDYIRCTNLQDITVTTPFAKNPVPVSGKTAVNEVVPSFDATTDTKGFGRFLTISSASILFIATADGDWNNATANSQFFSAAPYSPIPTSPAVGQEKVQAAFLLNLFDPAMGYPQMTPDYKNYTITVTGLDGFSWSGSPGSMGFPSTQTEAVTTYSMANQRSYGGSWGVSPLFEIIGTTPANAPNPVSPTPIPSFNAGWDPLNAGPPLSQQALFTKGASFAFNGGTAVVTISYKGTPIQTINLKFPSATLSLPKLVNSDLTPYGTAGSVSNTTSYSSSQETWSLPPKAPATGNASPTAFPWYVPVNTGVTQIVDFSNFESRFDFYANGSGNSWQPSTAVVTPYDTVVSIINTSGDIRLSAAKNYISASDPVFSPHPLYGTSPMAHCLIQADGTPFWGATRGALAHLPNMATSSPYSTGYFCNTPYNWAESSYQKYYAPPGAIPFPAAQSSPGVTPSGSNSNSGIMSYYLNGCTTPNFTVPSASNTYGNGRYNLSAFTLEPEVRSTDGVVSGYVPTTPTTSTNDYANSPGSSTTKVPGDWDNGMSNIKDGPYINKPDEGSGASTTVSPYFDYANQGNAVTTSTFSPNRQIPSPVMFGSLPTGVFANRPWQTLLFHPDYTGNHVGNGGVGGDGTPLAGAPPDHLLLDLFTMPVVEPYAISEPLSTAGRINMNYQILPFTYINRDTGIRAVMKSERILAIPNIDSGGPVSGGGSVGPYKTSYTSNTTGGANSGVGGSTSYITPDLRFDINASETIKGFQARFAGGDVFRSPSEICTLDLIPQDNLSDSGGLATTLPAYSTTGSVMQSYWMDHALTGDNSRERPYADIYPRLTTKSNTFTIHMRVQTLQQTKSDIAANPTLWTEGTDVVTGEYRGSETIERYVDPNDTRLIDYAANPSTTPSITLGSLYKFRIVSTKQFAP